MQKKTKPNFIPRDPQDFFFLIVPGTIPYHHSHFYNKAMFSLIMLR